MQLETRNQKLGTFTSSNHISQNRRLFTKDFYHRKQGLSPQIPSCHPAMCAADSGKWHPNQRRRRQAQRMDTIRGIAPLHAIATASPVQRATCPLPFHGDRYSKKNKRKHSIKERTLIYRIGNADIIIHCICIRLPVVQNKTRLRHFRIYRPEMTDSGHEIGGERCR